MKFALSRNRQFIKTEPKMSSRFKPYAFIILIPLLFTLLLGVPLSMASRLPTVCNIFHDKPVDKGGSCGHKAMFSKIQVTSFQIEAVHVASVDLAIGSFTPIPNNRSPLLASIADLPQSAPLRC
jgi:hypothetical protein